MKINESIENKERAKRILQAVDTIESTLWDPQGTCEIGKSVGYSHFHFHSIFREMTGYSPQDYQRRRRITNAAKCLLQSKLSIERIAWDAGFDNGASFSKAFKKQYHCSPSKYRKEGIPLWTRDVVPIESSYLDWLITGKFQPNPRIVEFQTQDFEGWRLLISKDDEHPIPISLLEWAQFNSCLELLDWPSSYPDDDRKRWSACAVNLTLKQIPPELLSEWKGRLNSISKEYLGTWGNFQEGGQYFRFEFKGSKEEYRWYNRWIWNSWEPRMRSFVDTARAVRTQVIQSQGMDLLHYITLIPTNKEPSKINIKIRPHHLIDLIALLGIHYPQAVDFKLYSVLKNSVAQVYKDLTKLVESTSEERPWVQWVCAADSVCEGCDKLLSDRTCIDVLAQVPGNPSKQKYNDALDIKILNEFGCLDGEWVSWSQAMAQIDLCIESAPKWIAHPGEDWEQKLKGVKLGLEKLSETKK